MKKIQIINEGRLIDDEMMYLMGGATSCPSTYSDGTLYCGGPYADKPCINKHTVCDDMHMTCSSNGYSVCPISYESKTSCPGYNPNLPGPMA